MSTARAATVTLVLKPSPQVSAFLPSTARPAMVRALEHRMRITVPMVVMANDDFGHWTRYLPRNPGFM